MNYRHFKLLSRLYRMNKPYVIPASHCRINCFFCSDKFCPPGLKNDILDSPVSVEMFKKLIQFINPDEESLILGEGYWNGGEFTAHPKWKKFIEILNRKFPGLPLKLRIARIPSREEAKFLAKHVDYLIISFSTFDQETRKQIKNSSGEDNLKERFHNLANYDLPTEISILALPELVGRQQREADIQFFEGLNNIVKINFLFPGYTRLTPEPIVEQLKINEEEYVKRIEELDKKFDLQLDMNSLFLKYITKDAFDRNYKRIESLVTSRTTPADRVLLLSSEKLYPVVKKVQQNLNEQYNAHLSSMFVENKFFGGNVNTGGLLTVDDYLECQDEINSREVDVILTTNAPYDIDGYDLKGIHKSTLEDKIDQPILFL